MDKTNSTFADWHAALCEHARKRGGSAADTDAWRDDFDAGKTPEEAWRDEWGD